MIEYVLERERETAGSRGSRKCVTSSLTPPGALESQVELEFPLTPVRGLGWALLRQSVSQPPQGRDLNPRPVGSSLRKAVCTLRRDAKEGDRPQTSWRI